MGAGPCRDYPPSRGDYCVLHSAFLQRMHSHADLRNGLMSVRKRRQISRACSSKREPEILFRSFKQGSPTKQAPAQNVTTLKLRDGTVWLLTTGHPERRTIWAVCTLAASAFSRTTERL